MRHFPLFLAVASLMATLAGCVPAPRPEAVVVPVRAEFPAEFYRRALAAGQPVFSINQKHSEIVIHVYRGGSLARFGHDHVVATRAVRGYALLPKDLSGAQADLYFPVEALVVDDRALRARAGFTTTPTDADIQATRRNMLDSVLEATRFPHVVVDASCAEVRPVCSVLDVRITLHGTTRQLRIPVELQRDGGRAIVGGRVRLRHSAFGMNPFATLGGALRVEDGIDLSFRLEVRRESDGVNNLSALVPYYPRNGS